MAAFNENHNDAYNLCMSFEHGLSELVGKYPFDNTPSHGILDLLFSKRLNAPNTIQPDFNTGSNQVGSCWAGKTKRLDLTYVNPMCDDVEEIDCNNIDLCNADLTNYSEGVASVTIDECHAFQLKYTKKQFANLCACREDVIATTWLQHFRKHHAKLAGKVITQIKPLIGHTLDVDKNPIHGTLPIPLLAPEGEGVSVKGDMILNRTMRHTGWEGTPIVLGAGKWEEYLHLKDYACCNQYGVNANAKGTAPYFDLFLDDTIAKCLGNPDEAIAFMPGSLKFLYWNENAGQNEEDGMAYDGTIQDPIYPDLVWDVFFRTKNCSTNTEYIYTFILRWDLFSIPDSALCDGSNGIFKFLATCATKNGCCPTTPDCSMLKAELL